MVAQEPDDVAIRSMKLAHYKRYRNEEAAKDFWRSPVIRFFLPNSADWSIKENPYAHHHKYEVYSLDNPYLNYGTNDFRHHM